MRVAAVIGTIFMLILGFVPCHNSASCLYAERYTHSQKSNIPPKKEACPPLCVCACNSGVTLLEVNSYEETIVITEFVKVPSIVYQNLYSGIYLNDIWQPPT